MVQLQIICQRPVEIRELGLKLRTGQVINIDESASTLKSLLKAEDEGSITIRRRDPVRGPVPSTAQNSRVPVMGMLLQGPRNNRVYPIAPTKREDAHQAPVVTAPNPHDHESRRVLEGKIEKLTAALERMASTDVEWKSHLSREIADLQTKIDGMAVAPVQERVIVTSTTAEPVVSRGPEVSYVPKDLGVVAESTAVNVDIQGDEDHAASDIEEAVKSLKKAKKGRK